MITHDLTSVDMLYAVNTKKEPAATKSPGFANELLPVTSSTISISNLLELVNRYYPDVISKDVLNHFGRKDRPKSELSDDIKYQDRDGGSESNKKSSSQNVKEQTKYQLRKDIDGETFVDVDSDIIKESDGRSIASVIAEIIKNIFNNLIETNNQLIRINATTNREWRRSNDAINLVKRSPAVYNDKFGAFDGEKWAFYDWKNNKLFGDYDEVTSLKNGIAAVRNGDSWTLINEKGKQITKKTFVDVKDNGREEVYSNGIIVATENGETYSFYDKNGKKVGKTEFEDADAFNENGYAAVKIDGKWGFADNKGNVVIKPKYKEAKSYSCGYASVENENGLWGYINEDEKLVIDYEFDDGNDFTSAGTALVKNNYSWSTLILYKYNHED